MASYTEAAEMRNAVLEDVARRLNLRPRAVGVMPLGNRHYAVKVTLASEPLVTLPDEIRGIPVRYDIQSRRPVMATTRF
jgi:hypothetical protein